MRQRPPRSTRTDTLLPYTTRCRSVDDRAAALRRHDPRGVLGPQKNAARHHREACVPVVGLDFHDRAERAGDPGIVEGDIEPAPAVDRGLHQPRDIAFLRDLPAERRDILARGARPTPRVARGFILVDDDDSRALVQKTAPARNADAACPPRDPRTLF